MGFVRQVSRGSCHPGAVPPAKSSDGAALTDRRWRYYATQSGKAPVRDFLDALDPADAAAVVAEMKRIRRDGLTRAHRISGQQDIYEVITKSGNKALRVLFAPVGKRDQVLLALEGLKKTEMKTPKTSIDTAVSRLADWRRRGTEMRAQRGARALA